MTDLHTRIFRALCDCRCDGPVDQGGCSDRKYGNCRVLQALPCCALHRMADSLIAAGVTFGEPEKAAADVAPVVHGRWIEEDGYQICSICGGHCWEDYRASYCEDCGAKMDLEVYDG